MTLNEYFYLISGILVGIVILKTINSYILWRKVRSYVTEFPSTQLKSPTDIPCNYHKWTPIKLAVSGLEFKTYDICFDCGFICGEDKYLNGSGLQMLREKAEVQRKKQLIDSLTRQHITEGIGVLKDTYCGMFTQDQEQNKRLLQMFYDDSLVVITQAPKAVKEKHGG